MDLFADLAKFGIKKPVVQEEAEKKKAKVEEKVPVVLKESDMLAKKTTKCDICARDFDVLVLRTSKAKREEADRDLRPRYEGIDAVKYGVTSCPFCGYTAMHKHFGKNTPTQRKWLKEQVCDSFKPSGLPSDDTYTYHEAVDRYKLALVCAMVRRAKASEKAFIYLNIAWLRAEQLAKGVGDDVARDRYQKEYDACYLEAYNGFKEALASEYEPYEGMDTKTLEYVLANMAMHFGDYKDAYKYVMNVMQSLPPNSRRRDTCLEIKDIIRDKMKEEK